MTERTKTPVAETGTEARPLGVKWSDLLYSVFSKLEWNEGENQRERKYLCLIDISYFAERTVYPEPYF